MRALIAAFALILGLHSASAASHGSPWANTGSPIGANLTQQSFSGNGQQPWMNIFKSGGDWITTNTATVCSSDTGEESTLYASYLDANLYPTNTAPGGAVSFTAVCTTLNQSMPTPYLYPSGNYRVTFSGGGGGATIVFGGDAALTTCAISPCTVAVTPGGSGIQIAIRGVTSSANEFTNIAVVYSANTAAYDAGEIFDPSFVAKHQQFSTIRFMQATNTITNQDINWSDRPLQSYAFWNVGNGFSPVFTPKGWPWEVVIAFCNKINADCWVNEPCLATTAYATSMAALFASSLHGNLRVIPEFCNETWNNGQIPTAIFNIMVSRGHVLFPAGGTTDVTAERLYALQRMIDDAALWKTAFGNNSANVIRVFGGWAGNNQYNIDLLGYTTPINGGGTWSGTAGGTAHFDAGITAPYYDITPPSAYTGDTDGGLSRFYCEMSDGMIPPGCSGTVPTGAGAATTAGNSTAYTLTDGTGNGCGAVNANGYAVAAILHTANGSNPTLSVNGCTAEPILCDGGAPSPCAAGIAPSAALLSSGPWLLVYTNATSAGSVTTSWRVVCGVGQQCSGTSIGASQVFIANNLSTFSSYSMGLMLYEGGWGFVAPSNNDLWRTLYDAAALDPRSYQTTELLMQGLRATGLNGVFSYFAGVNAGGFMGENWGLLDSVYETSAPKYQGALDFIRRNPCWWSNCRH